MLNFHDTELLSIEGVGAGVGRELRSKSIRAVLIALHYVALHRIYLLVSCICSWCSCSIVS